MKLWTPKLWTPHEEPEQEIDEHTPLVRTNRKQRRDLFRHTAPRHVRKLVFGRWRTRYAHGTYGVGPSSR